MAVSYREINYSLRPAKAVERKMMARDFDGCIPFNVLLNIGTSASAPSISQTFNSYTARSDSMT